MPRLDFVIFGATGFTGRYVVEDVLCRVENDKESLTWGVAGRNEAKLKKVLADVGAKYKIDLSAIPVIIADATDENSLKQMAIQAKVILNCSGPYRFTGELVVKACVENGTHHVDISGEPQFLESMQLKYSQLAEKNGAYVVGACGFDSIPTDVGINFLEKNFNGQVNAVETYMEMGYHGNNLNTALINITTWESAIYGFAHADELKELRRKLYPDRLPPLTPRLKSRGPLHWSPVVNKWCLPFPGSDRSVVQRTQRFLLTQEKKRPVQISTYVAFPSLFYALVTVLVSAVFGTLALFDAGRKLLLKYPKLFSFGNISHEGPSEEVAAATSFSITLIGNGWTEKLAEPLDAHADPPNKKLAVKISGMNPAYKATAAALVLSGLVILREPDRLPNKGGVFSPAAAFLKTSIAERLTRSEVKFEILNENAVKFGQNGSLLAFLGSWVEDLLNFDFPFLFRRGGVFTPGAAFLNTSLIDKLVDNGFAFSVIPLSKL